MLIRQIDERQNPGDSFGFEAYSRIERSIASSLSTPKCCNLQNLQDARGCEIEISHVVARAALLVESALPTPDIASATLRHEQLQPPGHRIPEVRAVVATGG